MSVKIKDRKTEVEYLRMVCNLAEIGINYEHAELIIKLQEKLKKLNGEFTLQDGIDVHHKWKQKWDQYYKAEYDK